MKPRSVVGVLSALLCFLATIYVCHCQKTYYQASSSVSVVLYYECLCPYSRAFITQQLWPTFLKLGRYMNVRVVPYGNAKMITGSRGSKVTFKCQHGENECYGNRVQACAANMAKSMKLFLQFLYCMSLKSNAHLYGKSCATSVGSFKWNFIEKCARGRQGEKLLRQMDRLTRGHWPRIGYVPYVEVNGHLNPRATTNLFSLICELLGKPKPKICLADNMVGDGSANLVERFPLGRRREQEPGYHYSCQHGPEECFGNVVQSCAAHIFNDTILSLAFVTCMSLAQRPQEAGEECARGIARNWDAIQRCAHGGKGLRLQDQMSERTWNLDPPHHYVPWIVVNGEHTDDIQAMAQTDLLQVVCDATPDGRKPPPCFEDMERRRALQKLSASVEERLGDGAAQPGATAGHSLKDVWL